MSTRPPRAVCAARGPRDGALRPLHAPSMPCDRETFEARTSTRIASAILLPERRIDALTALQRARANELQAMCDALSLRKSGMTKAAMAEAIVSQMQRGVQRACAASADVPVATTALAGTRMADFRTWFAHVRAGEEAAFVARPDREARARWEEVYKKENESALAYYETDAARRYKAYALFNAKWEDVPLKIRTLMTALDHRWPYHEYGALLFEGETCWSNDPRKNRLIIESLAEEVSGTLDEMLARRLNYWKISSVKKTIESEYRERLSPLRPLPPLYEGGQEEGPRRDTEWNIFGEELNQINPPPNVAMVTQARAIAPVAVVAPKNTTPPKKNATATTQSKFGTTDAERAFYARLEKADPLYEMISPQDNPSYPPGDIVKPQNVLPMKTFQQCFFLSQTELSFLQRESEFELQAVCMLQNDDVKERIQWPLDVYLTANDHTLSVVKRSSIKSVTKSTRDPAVRIPVTRLRCGSNHIRMFHRDKRGNFMIAVRIVRKRDLEDVAATVTEAVSEDKALKNALKWLGFTKKDDEIIMEDVALVSLRCPISGLMCTDPARLSACSGLHAFDAKSFIQLNSVSRKWSCPECGKKGGPTELRVDSFLKRCTNIIRERGLTKVSRMEINKDGQWRPREEPGAPALSASALRWYSPKISRGSIEWTLEDEKGSPASTSTKVAADSNVNTPNVESKEAMQVKTEAEDNNGEDSELDEEEEYKRAIREAAEFCGAQKQSSAKKRSEPDVIIISDSENDTAGQCANGSSSAHKRPKPSSAHKRPKPSSSLARNVANAQSNGRPYDWILDAMNRSLVPGCDERTSI
ncbi:Rubredoxin, iron-binding site [Ostreococcus tauri]|uniref:Rubredoxin, iron-binding site n=1 Tax=Ostreococcus tauri TaxID=70448 RepID=A0A090N4I8_OSTTA|nr:Rubredoxin, iron-binding site [Ostreococcus tauri]CEF99943.1 Rubredoxin, iron-binding site [Ostreococcus tauri]|eukprot:XP_022840123.1 Rubredoxin, iron-binding site [Ostreococcus tauri]